MSYHVRIFLGRVITMANVEERLTYTPEEARHLLGCSRSVMYESLRQNLIPHLKLGRKYIIPKFGFHRWLGEAVSPNEVAHPNSDTTYQPPGN